MMPMLTDPDAGTVDVEAKEVDGKAAEECDDRARRAVGENFTFHSVLSHFIPWRKKGGGGSCFTLCGSRVPALVMLYFMQCRSLDHPLNPTENNQLVRTCCYSKLDGIPQSLCNHCFESINQGGRGNMSNFVSCIVPR